MTRTVCSTGLFTSAFAMLWNFDDGISGDRPINAVRVLLLALFQAAGMIGTVLAQSSGGTPPVESPFSAFIAFDNGVGLNDGWSPERQAELLRALGFDGIAYTGIDDLDRRLLALDHAGLKVFSLYYDVSRTQDAEDLATFGAALDRLAGTSVDLWMPISKPEQDDNVLVAHIQSIAGRTQKNGGRVVLYPHSGSYIPTAKVALALVKRIDRANVGLAINLCHELKAGKGDELEETIKLCAPHLMLVSINGADRQSKEWNKLIQPLDRGDFDVLALLQQLQSIGYSGPIGLQCFGVREDPRLHLTRSMNEWNKLKGQLATASKAQDNGK